MIFRRSKQRFKSGEYLKTSTLKQARGCSGDFQLTAGFKGHFVNALYQEVYINEYSSTHSGRISPSMKADLCRLTYYVDQQLITQSGTDIDQEQTIASLMKAVGQSN